MLFPTRIRRRTFRHAFEEALDLALDERADAGVAFPEDVSGLDSGRQSATAQGFADLVEQSPYVGSGSLSAAYAAEIDPESARAAFDPKIAAQQVERALKRTLSVEELQRLRRRFAAQNHPDRVPLHMRPAAQQAMAEINSKIDKAVDLARQRKA